VWVRGYREKKKRVKAADGRFFWPALTCQLPLPRRAGSKSDRLDQKPPAGQPGATITAARYDTNGERNEHASMAEQDMMRTDREIKSEKLTL